jgi:hypothetical protein
MLLYFFIFLYNYIFIWLYNYANIGVFVCLFGETIHGHGVLPSSHGIVCYHRIA